MSSLGHIGANPIGWAGEVREALSDYRNFILRLVPLSGVEPAYPGMSFTVPPLLYQLSYSGIVRSGFNGEAPSDTSLEFHNVRGGDCGAAAP